MVSLSFGGTYLGGALTGPAVAAEMIFVGSGAARELHLVDFATGITTRFAVTAGGIGTMLGQVSHTLNRTSLIAGDFYGSVLTGVVTAALDPATTDAQSAYLHLNADYDERVELLGASVGGQSYLIAAESVGSGFSIFSVGAGGALTLQGSVQDDGGSYAAGITALARVTVGGHSFILTGSASESGVSSYEVLAGGQIAHRDSIGVGEVVPLQAVTELRTVSTAGQDYVLVGSATNSALTVLRVAADGSMVATDHVVDDLLTRFSSVTALATLNVNGRAFVVAGGRDDGLSLFTLLPGGQLLHLQTLGDSASTTLAAPSDITMTLVGTEIQIFVSSGLEAGLTLYRIDIAALGQTLAQPGSVLPGGSGDDLLVLTGGDGLLSGGGGADILRDGAGNDALRGGAGPDIFVLTEDGRADTILDFEPGKDRIDLTLLPFLRNLQQLQFTPITGGIVIQYGAELLTVLTANGNSLTQADFAANGLLPLTRFPIVPGATGVVPDLWGQTPATPVLHQGTLSADTLTGTAGSDFYNGMDGNDTLVASAGADHFDGGTGVDLVSYAGLGAAGVDLDHPGLNWGSAAGHSFASVENITGSAFADALTGDALANLLSGGDGNDTLIGGDGNDVIRAGRDNDVVNGGADNDRIELGTGDDTASGASGDDTLYGGPGSDLLSGADGNDVVYGEDGNDILAGGAGNDTLDGGVDHDQLLGGGGDDLIFGAAGDDSLLGLTGADVLSGGDGNDTLSGGAADDALNGGAGADVFLFDSFRPGEVDVIEDFEPGIDLIAMRHVADPGDNNGFAALGITPVAGGYEVSFAGHVIEVFGPLDFTLCPTDFLFH